MSISPQTVIDEVQRHLRDTGAGTWADADCVEYFNNATYVLMSVRPHAFASIENLTLTADSTSQSLTAGTHYMLLDVIRNMGSDGATEGVTITKIPRWQLDMLNRHWHKGLGKTFIEHYSYDPEKSLVDFYVFPKPHATTAVLVEVNVAKYPTKVTTANQATTITLDQTFEPFIKEWMFYEAYNKNTTPTSFSQSQRHLTNAASIIGMKVQALREASVRARVSE